MRIKRAKAYRKLMSLYSTSFGFREPYQVLVDAEICKAAILQNLALATQLGAVLQGTVKPMITQCCIHELYLQGKPQQPAVDLAKTFERRRCNHREPLASDTCLASVVGETNKHRYVVATQSQALRAALRAIPAVPLVHFNRSVMILEPPSTATLAAKRSVEEEALHPSAPELAALPTSLKDDADADTEPVRKKRKGPKGPNPLSVKKKKAKPDAAAPKQMPAAREEAEEAGEKRKHVDEDADEIVGAAELPAVDGAGHKRKRRRKTNARTTEVPAGTVATRTPIISTA